MIIAVPKLRQEAITISEGIRERGGPEPVRPIDADPAENGVDQPDVLPEQEPPDHGHRDDRGDDGGVVADSKDRAELRDPLVQRQRSRQSDAQRQRDADDHEVGGVERGLSEPLVSKDVGVVLKSDETHGER